MSIETNSISGVWPLTAVGPSPSLLSSSVWSGQWESPYGPPWALGKLKPSTTHPVLERPSLRLCPLPVKTNHWPPSSQPIPPRWVLLHPEVSMCVWPVMSASTLECIPGWVALTPPPAGQLQDNLLFGIYMEYKLQKARGFAYCVWSRISGPRHSAETQQTFRNVCWTNAFVCLRASWHPALSSFLPATKPPETEQRVVQRKSGERLRN